MASRPAPRHRRSASTARPERHNDCVFTSQTWARHATKELLRASTAVDNVCHAIVTARTAYGDGDILDELRRLALTVAVLERSLFAYADRIRIHSTAPKAVPHASAEVVRPPTISSLGAFMATAPMPPPSSDSPPRANTNSAGSLVGLVANGEPATETSSVNVGPNAHSPEKAPVERPASVDVGRRSPPEEPSRASGKAPETTAPASVKSPNGASDARLGVGVFLHDAGDCGERLPDQQRRETHSIQNDDAESTGSFPSVVSRSFRRQNSVSSSISSMESFEDASSPTRANVPVSPSTSGMTANSMADLVSTSATSESRRTPWKHPGGIVSLLTLMHKNLSAMRQTLHLLSRWSSLRSFAHHSPDWCAYALASSALTAFAADIALRKSSWLRRLFRRSSLFSLDVTWTGFAILLGSPLCIISILHSRMRQARFRLLRELHLQLRLLQQLWSMAVEHLDEPRAGAGVPISRWTLDYVPPIGISYAEVSRSLWFLSYMLNVFYASASVWSSTSSCRWYGVPMALAAGATFGMCPQWAASVARDFLSSPRLRDVKCEWAVADAWLTKRLSPVFLSISGNAKSLDLNRFLHYKVPSGQDIRLRCLRQRGGSSMIGDMAQNLARFGSELSPIVLVVRSGSWVSNVVAADMGFLCTWAHTTGALVVAADFPMEADHAFPDAVCDAFETYKWIVGGGLGFVPPRVVLVGDGAGGTLAASLCIQASLRCVRRPDRLILLYPALNVRSTLTPSRSAFPNDMIVPVALLTQSKAIFIPCNSSVELDFSVAPMSAPDRLLASFPPTSIVCGAIDPLVDDSIDFAHRLSSVGVFCQLKVYSKLIHGFLGFAALLPAAAGAVDLVGQWLLTGLNSRNSAGGGLVTDKVIP